LIEGNTVENWQGISIHTDGWEVIFTRNFKATEDDDKVGGDVLAAQ